MLVLKYFQLRAGFDILPRPRRGNKHEFRNVSTRHRSFFFWESHVQHLASCGDVPPKWGKHHKAPLEAGKGELLGGSLVFTPLLLSLFLLSSKTHFFPPEMPHSRLLFLPGCRWLRRPNSPWRCMPADGPKAWAVETLEIKAARKFAAIFIPL